MMTGGEIPNVIVLSKDSIPMLAREIAKHINKDGTGNKVGGEEFVTRAEAAAMLKVSASTITNWINKDILHPVYRGMKCYFRLEEIQELLNG